MVQVLSSGSSHADDIVLSNMSAMLDLVLLDIKVILFTFIMITDMLNILFYVSTCGW